ncbi:MAG: TetR/AcrR family transcriptional regulator [Ilumatobacteraceae bacterium]
MGTSLRERNRAANRAAIQSVALDRMARSGFDGVTIEQIAADAGVSTSTVYRYFGTKEALVLSGAGTDRLATAIAAEAVARPKASAVGLFRRAAADVIGGAESGELLTRLRLVFADASLAAAFEHLVLDQRHDVAGVLADHRGAATPGVRDAATAGALLGLYVSVLDRWQETGGKKPLVKTLNKSLAALE